MNYTVNYQTKKVNGSTVSEGTVYVNGIKFRTYTNDNKAKLVNYINVMMRFAMASVSMSNQILSQISK